MNTYKIGLKRGSKIGWKHADDDSMQCAISRTLGFIYCLKPEAIYKWSLKHNIDLTKEHKRFKEPSEGILLQCVLNDNIEGLQ